MRGHGPPMPALFTENAKMKELGPIGGHALGTPPRSANAQWEIQEPQLFSFSNNQEVVSFISLPLPCTEGIVLISNIDLFCVKAIFNGSYVTCLIGDILHIEHQFRQLKEN